MEIVFASYDTSYPDRNGGTRIRSQVISFFQEHGFLLFLAQGDRAVASDYPLAMQRLFHQPPLMRIVTSIRFVKHAYFNLWLFWVVLQRSRTHTEVVVQNGWVTIPATYLLRILGRCKWISMLVDPITNDDGFIESRLSTRLDESSWKKVLPFSFARVIETLSRRAEYVTVVNRSEAKALQALSFRPERIKCIPITTPVLEGPGILASKDFREGFLVEHGLLPNTRLVAFHGHLVTPPNKRAVERILTYIAPKTHELDRSIVFLIIGDGEKPHRVEPNVLFVGYVDDLNKLLSNVDIVIVPLESGSGMKNKILDALNCGIPVISTEVGLSGFESQECPVVLSRTDDFPKAIVEATRNPDRSHIGTTGWKYVKGNYSPDLLLEYARILRESLKN